MAIISLSYLSREVASVSRRWLVLPALAVLVLLTFSGDALKINHCRYLQEKLEQAGAEEIWFTGYYLFRESEALREPLKALQDSLDREWERVLIFRGQPAVAGGVAASGWSLLQVSGGDGLACHRFFNQAERLLGKIAAPQARAWRVEAFFDRRPEELSRLARLLLEQLGAEQQYVYQGREGINILAYLPLVGGYLLIDGVPVNLNLELRYDSYRKMVRLRAGVPVLITGVTEGRQTAANFLPESRLLFRKQGKGDYLWKSCSSRAVSP